MEISSVKNFAGNEIQTRNLLTLRFFFTWSTFLDSDLHLSCTVGTQLVASALGDLAVAATVLVASKQTQSLFIQESCRPTVLTFYL